MQQWTQNTKISHSWKCEKTRNTLLTVMNKHTCKRTMLYNFFFLKLGIEQQRTGEVKKKKKITS